MQYYSNPTIKDVMTEIEALQKQVEALRGESAHGLFNKETFVEAVGWISLKQDIAEIKEQLELVAKKIT